MTAFQRLVVVLSHGFASRGAFSHALEWASALGLPLRGIALGRQMEQDQQRAEACARRGVYWEWLGYGLRSLKEVPAYLHAKDLLLLGPEADSPQRRELVRRLIREDQTLVLAGTENWAPVKRILALDRGGERDLQSLNRVVALCCGFDASLIVLTAATSEHAVIRRQQLIRARLDQLVEQHY